MIRKPVSSIAACIVAFSLLLSACSLFNPFPLSSPGKYDFGTRQDYAFTDPARNDRPVGLTVWYPATLAKDALPSSYNYNAEPDRSGAPYPVILSSAKVGSIFGPHMASHGFVVIGVNGQDSSMRCGTWLIDYPLDLIFALDQAAAGLLAGLEGMLDTDHAGAMGYSFDSYTSLALGGARLDLQFLADKCSRRTGPTDMGANYNCYPLEILDEFSAHAGPAITASDDGLWQPITDERILAVMPMGPEGAWLFGDRGLAAVDRPLLFIAASQDDINIYAEEAVYLFEHAGGPDTAMITFIGWDHMMIYSDEPVAWMKHFAVAFFGLHLQGNEKYSRYLMPETVNKTDGVAWGVYAGE